MLVDDSRIARSIIGRILRDDGRFDVLEEAECAESALRYGEIRTVDIIVLDIEMPGLSGLDAMPLLMKSAQNAHIFILSSVCESGGIAAIRALSQGASGVMSKPGGAKMSGQFGRVLCDSLAALCPWARAPEPVGFAAARALNKKSASVATQISSVDAHSPKTRMAHKNVPFAVAIGGSTGAISALQDILRHMPRDFSAPIFVTQHLPDDFFPYFASELDTLWPTPVAILADKMPILPGGLYLVRNSISFSIVPGKQGYMAQIAEQRGTSMRHHAHPEESSVDRMLMSLAQVYGANLDAVILSGMGRDGVYGASHVAAAGGNILIQDRASAAIWGMPGAIIEAGLAHTILTPKKIAAHLGTLMSKAAHIA